MTSDVPKAVETLRRGGIVAFPTETVYGLGADATSSRAVLRVFEAKGRPATNPVIVHVADEDVARRYARAWPRAATRLVEEFWPGPLTLVLPKTVEIVSECTAGRDTVGLRAPDHPLTLELLRAFGGPMIGPSANRSSHVSPTTAQHVQDDLGDRVDLLLDGGACRVGIESTVLDLSTETPTILRPGAVSREHLEQAIGPVQIARMQTDIAASAKSPGQHVVHYAPRTSTFRFASNELHLIDHWLATHPGLTAVVISIQPLHASDRLTLIALPPTPREYAQGLYAALRRADALRASAILIEMPPDEPSWLAIRDRLMRASRPL